MNKHSSVNFNRAQKEISKRLTTLKLFRNKLSNSRRPRGLETLSSPKYSLGFIIVRAVLRKYLVLQHFGITICCDPSFSQLKNLQTSDNSTDF